MDTLDEAAAVQFQSIHADLQNGFWNTGQLGAKGFVVEEPVNSEEQTAHDSIKRYTDKYLPRKKIGRTTSDFDFQKLFLPRELYKAAGIAVETANGAAVKSETRRVVDIDRLMRENGEEGENSEKDGAANANGAKDDDSEEDNEQQEEEEEFEELEDDDYNAEKYFDDGDEYGDGDDGDGEAAY